MNDLWWACKSCGHESYDSVKAFHHTSDTGHDGHALVSRDTTTGRGSTEAGRRRARELYEESRGGRG